MLHLYYYLVVVALFLLLVVGFVIAIIEDILAPRSDKGLVILLAQRFGHLMEELLAHGAS
jgi:hypothetical protein